MIAARVLLIIGIVISGLAGVVAAMMLAAGSFEMFPTGEQQEKTRIAWSIVLVGASCAVLVQWQLYRKIRRR